MVCRQDLRQQIFEQQLAEPAAQLRGLQDLLQRRDVLADLVDLAVGFFEAAEAAVHGADHLRGAVQALTEGTMRMLHQLDVFVQPLVDGGRDLRQLLIEGLRVGVERPAELVAQAFDLLLQQDRRAIGLARGTQGFKARRGLPLTQ